MKAEKNSTGRSPGKMSKHFRQGGRSLQAHDIQNRNAAADNESNDASTVNGSLASAPKLQSGKKPLKTRGAPNTAGSNTDSMNVSQVSDESNNTTSETSVAAKDKGTKKRKPQKRLADKGSSEDGHLETSEEQGSAILEKVSHKNVASSKKRKSEQCKVSGKDAGKDKLVKGKQKKLEMQKRKMEDAASAETDAEIPAAEQLQYWKRLRQDLERVRLLLELIRKREKMKSSLVGFCCSVCFDSAG